VLGYLGRSTCFRFHVRFVIKSCAYSLLSFSSSRSDATFGVRSILLLFLFSPSTVRMPLLVFVRFFFSFSFLHPPFGCHFWCPFGLFFPVRMPLSVSDVSAAQCAEVQCHPPYRPRIKSNGFARDLPGVLVGIFQVTGAFYRFELGTRRRTDSHSEGSCVSLCSARLFLVAPELVGQPASSDAVRVRACKTQFVRQAPFSSI
jgi:hypothetical protein